jgi:rubrerythrin
MTTNQCPICKEPFDQIQFITTVMTTVDGQQQYICRECAHGIASGIEILRANGVTHESTDPSHEK